MINADDDRVIEVANELHIGPKLVALIVNKYEGNEEEVEEVEPLEDIPEPGELGGGNEPVEEVPMGEGNKVFDDYQGKDEVVALGAGWYQVGEEKYHGKAALEEAGYTLEDEEE